MYFVFHVENEFGSTPFIVESDTMLNAHIKFQECVEKINEALNKEFEGREQARCKTTVSNVHEAPFVQFSEEWLKEYVEEAIEQVREEFEHDCDEDD